MKKLLIALFLIAVITPLFAEAQSVLRVRQGGTGASTLSGCLQGNGTDAITGTGSPCGSGGGGGGGTFSTTTSTVSGQLINYPNNTTDIVCIGSNATTTCEYYFDPNLVLAKINNQFFGLSSTTLQNFTAVNGTTTNATSTNLNILSLFGLDGLYFDSLTDDATLDNNAGDLRVVDVTCTDCLNATEIEDIYVLNSGDTMTGSLTFSGVTTDITTATNEDLTINPAGAGDIVFTAFTNALIQAGAGGALAEYAGTSCTNQFVRSLSALGVATCATVANTDLANSTISGVSLGSNLNSLSNGSTLLGTSYNGSATVSDWDIDLSNQNVWTSASTTFVGGVTIGTATTTSATTTNFYVSNWAVLDNLSVTNQTTFNNDVTLANGAVLNLSENSIQAFNATGDASISLTNDGGAGQNLLNINVSGATDLQILNSGEVQVAGGFLVSGSTTLQNFTAVNATTTNATTTGFAISGITSAIPLTNANGSFAEYAGTSCTNQFVRSLSALGVATCATVSAGDVSLANLTATDTTLTFSGTYNGSTARTIGLNLSNANTWTGGQTFANATSTNFHVTANALSIGSAGQFVTATSTGGFRVASTSLDARGISFSTGTTSVQLATFPEARTLTSWYCIASSTGSVRVRFGDGTNWTSDVSCSTGSRTYPTSNNTFTADETVVVEIGTSASSPSTVTISPTWRKTSP